MTTRRRRSVQVIIIGGILVAVAVLWGIGYVLSGSADVVLASAALSEEMRKAQDEGLPLYVANIKPYPPVEAEENAAPLMRELAEEWLWISEQDRERLLSLAKAVRNGEDGAKAAEFDEALLEAEDILIVAMRAAERPRCDFERDWEQGYEVSFFEFAPARDAVGLLGARAVLRSRAGNLAAAISDLRAALRLARHTGSDPALIPMLVEAALELNVHGALKAVAAAQVDNPLVFEALSGLLDDLGALPDLRNALRGECLLGWITAQNLGRLAEDEKAALGIPKDERSRNRLQQAMMMRTLQFWREVFEAYPESETDLREVRERLREVSSRWENMRKPSYLLIANMSPVMLRRPVDKILQIEATRRLSRLLVEAVRYRQENGEFPAALGQLGATYLDPFDEKPLRYRRRKDGFVAYSVGPDLADNGGRKFQPGQWDIVLRFPN
ncbi:MAG: hypothetical protein IH851_00505 [Armatimonadetes bacterium]|nr:hypothetical protein [Armatimonadota bacterium]